MTESPLSGEGVTLATFADGSYLLATVSMYRGTSVCVFAVITRPRVCPLAYVRPLVA